MTSVYFLLVIILTTTHLIISSIINDLRQNVLSFTPKSLDKNDAERYHYQASSFIKQDKIDGPSAKEKAQLLRDRNRQKTKVEETEPSNFIRSDDNQRKSLSDVLQRLSLRRKYLSSDSSSSSIEMKNWKEEWREHWLQKKFEAINSSIPQGETVNMAAARPWGLPCGDPNQHDMPWGTCMLPMECEAEYRIYRGDYFCGRTQFVCCALQLTTYDMYQGFDVSFADSSLETDSDEKKSRQRGSREKRRRKKYRDRLRRKRDRLRRKRKMKRNIKKIIREIRKILNRSYRNGTTDRKRKTTQLKKFVKMMKKKYKEERKVIMDLHEIQLIQSDIAVQERLNQIKEMNREFIKNGTFRDIIVNGTYTKNDIRMLMEAYPDLAQAFETRRRDTTQPRDYLDYDIEYGYLYY